MKILQVTPRYYPSLGGVEEVVKQTSERLVKNFGHHVEVLTSNLDSDGSRELNGVSIHRLWSLPGMKYGPFQPIAPTLPFRYPFLRSDLVHLHANKRFVTDLAALFEVGKKRPFVFSPYAGMFGTTLLGRIHNKTIGKLAFNAAVVIVISQSEKKMIESQNMRVKRFEVLPIGVDVAEFKKADTEYWDQTYDLKGNKVVLFVGRLTTHKGVDTLIKAFASIKRKIGNVKLLVVGPDFGEKANFESMAKGQQISEDVIFSGGVSRERLLGAYKVGDVFVLPSRNEAFGIVMIEAMAAGLPVVAANNSSMPEIVRDGETGLLFNTEDAGSLAAKVVEILDDGALAQRFINNGSAEVAEKYNWDRIVEKLNALYQEVYAK